VFALRPRDDRLQPGARGVDATVPRRTQSRTRPVQSWPRP
jgi:hypothetical protein